MKIRNPTLYRSLKQFAEDAINLLHDALPTPEDIPTMLAFKLQVGKSGSWSLEQVERPQWWSLVQQHLSNIKQLAIHAKCMQVIQSDPIIASHLGQVVGTDGTGRTIVRPNAILPNFLNSLLSGSESLSISGGVFETLYQRMEQFFYSTQLHFCIVAPLINVTGPDRLIQVTDDVDMVPNPITRLEQWIRAAREGTLPAPWRHVPELSHSLECHFVAPKVIGDTTLSKRDHMDTSAEEASFSAALSRLRQAVSVLRLLKPYYVAVPFFEYEMQEWHPQPQIGWQAPLASPHWITLRPRYELAEDDASEIASLHKALGAKRKKAHRFIDRAVHRVARSVEEMEPGERLVDLVIALESLLLYDTGEPEDRGELGFRLALRGAYFLADDIEQRRKVYHELKKAYRLRSKIVHGSKPPANLSILSETIPIKQFVTLIENHAREATKRLLALSTRPDAPKQLVSWNDLVLGFPPPSSS